MATNPRGLRAWFHARHPRAAPSPRRGTPQLDRWRDVPADLFRAAHSRRALSREALRQLGFRTLDVAAETTSHLLDSGPDHRQGQERILREKRSLRGDSEANPYGRAL